VNRRIASVAGVACAAAALALAAPAMAAQGSGGGRPAVSGTEHIQIMSTSATSTTSRVIAFGVFTAPAIDHSGSNVDKFVFSNGSFKVRHVNGTGGTHSFNRRTCLGKITQPGTYRIFGGTGHYAGISGHGKFMLSILFIGAKSGGKCTQTKPPVAFQQLIRASGPVTL
jgi:hypothetical protein